MLKWIVILIMLISSPLAVFSTAHAAEPPHIGSLDILVWPEYDQPGVLVQYQGDLLGAKAGEQQEITFLVPKGAGVGAACGIKADGNHTSETWKETDAGDGFTAVTYKLADEKFHVEFYYSPLVGSTDKSMDFTYKTASPVDDLVLDIQHPVKATNFVLSPDGSQEEKGNDGFTYHIYDLKQVEAGKTVSSKISYTKTDPAPSVSGQKDAQPEAAQKEASQPFNTNVLIVFSILAASALLIGYFAFFRRQQPQFAFARAVPEATSVVVPGSFCTACGNHLDAGDRFCGKCGTRNRVESDRPQPA